eukprot:scaffold23191_cov27-Tisochrysis_lutea.AAC.3
MAHSSLEKCLSSSTFCALVYGLCLPKETISAFHEPPAASGRRILSTSACVHSSTLSASWLQLSPS